MSGFLNDGDFDKADQMIRDSFPDVEEEAEGFIGEPIETKEADDTTDEDTSEALDDDVKEEDGASLEATEEEDTPGHRVPYKRFKSVLDARNDYKGEIDTLRERNRELEAYLASKPSSPEPEAESDDYEFGYEEDDDLDLDYGGYDNKKVEQLEKHVHEIRVAQHKQKLIRDMEVIKERFPNVPPESVLQAVANDPSTNMFQVAETFNSFLVEREEAAIQRYLKEHPEAAQQAAPDAAPRPRKSGGGDSPGSSRVPKEKRPRQMKDVRHALLNYVKNNNIF
jgi:hypothetical protein